MKADMGAPIVKKNIAEHIARIAGVSVKDILKAHNEPADFDETKLEKHPNLDLFICNLTTLDSPKSDTVSMENPFYTLGGKGSKKVFQYTRKAPDGSEKTLTISPSAMGMPTQKDKDYLIHAISNLMWEKNKGNPISQVVEFDLWKFINATNRSKGGTYTDVTKSLSRLRQVSIRTTLKTGGKTSDSEFGLLDWWATEETDKTLKGKVRMKLSDYVWRAIQSNEVLTLDRRYFLIGTNLERRLYEIARKHCSKKTHWKISLAKLKEKTGWRNDIYKFRFKIKELTQKNTIPEYALRYNRQTDMVVFVTRKEAIKSEGTMAPVLDVEDPLIETEFRTYPVEPHHLESSSDTCIPPEASDVVTMPLQPKDIQEPESMADEGSINLHKEPAPKKKEPKRPLTLEDITKKWAVKEAEQEELF